MSFTFGMISTFDHTQQTWRTFKGKITQWFIANDIDAIKDPLGVKRRAILLSALAECTYRLAADLALPKTIETVPYEDIVDLLDNHFTPKQIGFGERHKFYSATQLPTETASQWAARLRGLTAQCGFTNVEEALRDRYIMGMLPGAEKEKLYVQDLAGLTLAKAVELVENLRSARAAAAASSNVAEHELYKIARSDSRSTNKGAKVKCSVCGYSNHSSAECRFANYTCRRCHVKGHLRRMCKSVKYVKKDEVSEGGDDDGESRLHSLNNIRSLKGEPLVETGTINGVELQFEIDSGSAVSVISDKTYELHFSNVPLSDTNKRLIGYTGEVLRCVGCARLMLEWRGRSRELQVYVVRGGGPPLLGRDFIAGFQLQLSPVYNCNVLKTNEIESLSLLYPGVFSDKLGRFNKYEVKLVLKENAKPIFVKARPMPFALKDRVDKEISRLVSLGILRPVDRSEYASPVVPVLKRDGSVRLCVDYSVSINKQLVVDQYPLPTVNELFAKLYGGQQFTKLDLSAAYNQLVLNEESQKYTCINTHRGLFAYTRLVFGLSSAPAIFQRVMEGLLAGITGVLCLLDDVLISGRDRTEHLERLHQVLQRFQDAGLALQKTKCEFFKDEISYLGYVINREGLKKSPDKIKAIVQAPVPKTVNQLQSFLGLVNYYRCFVPGASSILTPLYDLLKKGAKWRWSKAENDAFLDIKGKLTSDQILTHFNQHAKIILTVDASPSGLGAILSQIDSDQQEKPVAFASRTLNSAEKKYSQIQKEATAIIFGVRRFHQYLYGRSSPFVLRTDHKPLLSIFGPNKGIPEISANRLQRYALFLSGYNYVIEYVKSKDNCADFLSRASLPAPLTPTQGEADSCDRAAYVNFVTNGALPITVRELREATLKDTVLAKVIYYVLNGWPKKLNINDEKIKPFHLCKSQLAYENGCLMRGHKVVIPECLRQQVLGELHTSHLGIVKTKAEARSRFWFPGVDKALELMISSCDTCIQLRPSPPRASPSPWPYPSKPFHRLHLDFLGPLNGRMFLVIVDAYTKWVETYEMNSCNSVALIDKMYEFISRFGLPHTLVTDNGTAFSSQDFSKFCALNGISHLTSPPYHPASNGQAEIYVKVVKKGIKSSVLNAKNIRDSKLNLLKYMFDYRNSVHSMTNTSPAQLVFGRKLRSRLDLMHPSGAPHSPTPCTDLVNLKQCLQNKGCVNEVLLSPGQYVLYKRYVNKDKYIWVRGIILRTVGKRLYLIKDCSTSAVCKKHKDQIVLYKGSVDHNELWDVTDGLMASSDENTAPPSSVGEEMVSTSVAEREESPCWVTTRRGARQAPAVNDSAFSALQKDGQQLDVSQSPSWVAVRRGVRHPVESDGEDDFYRTTENDSSPVVS
jgi:hypothetical protein